MFCTLHYEYTRQIKQLKSLFIFRKRIQYQFNASTFRIFQFLIFLQERWVFWIPDWKIDEKSGCPFLFSVFKKLKTFGKWDPTYFLIVNWILKHMIASRRNRLLLLLYHSILFLVCYDVQKVSRQKWHQTCRVTTAIYAIYCIMQWLGVHITRLPPACLKFSTYFEKSVQDHANISPFRKLSHLPTRNLLELIRKSFVYKR